MGWLKLIANVLNAEGVREAMRIAYDRHYRLAQRRPNAMGEISAHEYALFGAIGSRLRLSGFCITQPQDWRRLVGPQTCDLQAELRIWLEVIPFLYLDESTAREALAEYVVYKELPLDVRRTWLKEVVNRGYRLTMNEEDADLESLLAICRAAKVEWMELTED
jgi:hypothetical protein